MNAKKRLRIAIILAVALLITVFGILIYVANQKKAVTIYDFCRNIPYNEKANYMIAETDLEPVEILAGDVKDDYVTDIADAVGKYLASDALKGQHVMKGQLSVEPTHLEKGGISELAEYRKFYLPIDYKTGFAGDITAGQTVDILFTEVHSRAGYPTDRTEDIPNSNPLIYGQSKIIMQNIPIYQVYTANGSVYKRRETDPDMVYEAETAEKEKAVAPAYVALTVTGEQYEDLYVRNLVGSLSLVSRFDGSDDIETDGHLYLKTGDACVYIGTGNLEYDPQIDMEAGELEWGEHDPLDIDTEDVQNKDNPLSIYKVITDMQKVSLNEAQRAQFRSVNQRLEAYMTELLGVDWKLNAPESITDEDILTLYKNEPEKLIAYGEWKQDTESLAKEIFGVDTEMPW